MMVINQPILLPAPRHMEFHSGYLNIMQNPSSTIFLEDRAPDNLLFSARQLQHCLEKKMGHPWPIRTDWNIPFDGTRINLSAAPEESPLPQSYILEITTKAIRINAHDQAGAFYGVQTLKQIIQQSRFGQLPCLLIHDWPDFPVRGVMLDISRDKVYSMNTLYTLVDELASWKVNQLQLYTEHTFAYRGHEIVWQTSSPMTPQEILSLDQYCRERYIDLVPNQNSFGHMTRWLKHPKYKHLAETTEPVQTPWGTTVTQPFSLAAVSEESLTFIKELYDQLLPNFSSQLFNVGCDETFDLGKGKSHQACKEKGKGQVYLDYLLTLNKNVQDRGLTMQFWGDIILQYPELVKKLPKNLIALDWGYEGDHPFLTETQQFMQAGVPYYVCPGTSSWNSIGGRIDNALENLKNAAQNGLAHHAAGYLNTDWGDNGHWQTLTISYPGLAAGAALSWCIESNYKIELTKVLNQVIFKDHHEKIGQILVSIGNEYKAWDLVLPNASPLFWLLQNPASKIKPFLLEDTTPIEETMGRLDANLNALRHCQLEHNDAPVILEEVELAIQMMKHACKRALRLTGSRGSDDANSMLYEIEKIIFNYQNVWHKRNRSGGLRDSTARFNHLIRAYETE